MNTKKVTAILQKRLAAIDWKLLVFLLLFLNVKLVVKVAAVVLICFLRPGFKLGFGIKNPRLPIFYLLIIGIALFNWLISGLLTNINYSLAVITGILFWLLCIIAAHQVKSAVEKNDPEIIHQTLLVFFIINAVASLAIYGSIVWETGAINPYKYQGNFQKYFIGTGDYIKGITMDTSTTNAVINAFGVVYFLLRNKLGWALLCMAILLLTGSNVTNLLLCTVLLYIFFFQSTKSQKSIIVVCLLFLVVFLAKISPENTSYVTDAYEKFSGKPKISKRQPAKIIPVTEKPDSILTPEEKQQKIAILYIDSMAAALVAKNSSATAHATTIITAENLKKKPEIPKANIHSAPFQHKNDTTFFQENLMAFIKADSVEQSVSAVKRYNMPGKIIALLQTAAYFQLHPLKIITGAGIGMFSSKLAFRISALKIAGGYPAKYAFISNDFKNNSLALYLNYFTKGSETHSLINTPNSTYTQLVGEYGLAGILAFIFFYLGFFVKQYKKLTYGIPVLLLMAGSFFLDYWFEQLSVTVLFELLLFLNIKENIKVQVVKS
ncbi:hypothetical protein [Ferruginibacter sp. SUN106]|uniref:hypothetical protein n=1 Tax=Ferruginibacter sp. SUN106 TaxID=2978348 RepID=UPI003D3607C9